MDEAYSLPFGKAVLAFPLTEEFDVSNPVTELAMKAFFSGAFEESAIGPKVIFQREYIQANNYREIPENNTALRSIYEEKRPALIVMGGGVTYKK